MKRLPKLILIFILIWFVAGMNKSPKGLINHNKHVPLVISKENLSPNKSTLYRTIRKKNCQKCNLDTHFDETSKKCPFNDGFTGLQSKLCNPCGSIDHSNKRSHLCKNNSRYDIILDESESHPRKCIDCNKDDHENKQSNLCLNNLNSLLYQKTIQQIVICQHCNLPGHKLKRHIDCLANPNNLSKQNNTNSLFNQSTSNSTPIRSIYNSTKTPTSEKPNFSPSQILKHTIYNRFYYETNKVIY